MSSKVLNGHCTLQGDGDDSDVRIDAGKSVVLDPERITAADSEWDVVRPGSSPGYRYEIVIGEHPLFTLQHFRQPAEPGDDPTWVERHRDDRAPDRGAPAPEADG